ncbi:MAG: hypothetical protein GPOALKHO_001730 [Sodalis sp.]|nr:MAG: hypothetical protein GPOALKHO_001730 [Sodalis sp.]
MLTAFNRMLDKAALGKLLLRFTFGVMMLFYSITSSPMVYSWERSLYH